MKRRNITYDSAHRVHRVRKIANGREYNATFSHTEDAEDLACNLERRAAEQ